MLRGLFLRGRLTQSAAVLCGLMVMPWLSGCGKQKQPWDTVHPAKGVITYKGKPVFDAQIALFPEDSSFPDSIRPRAKSNEDGEFVIWTNEPGDGAPAGTYKAVVVHHQIVDANGSMAVKPNDLPAKYSRRESTDLLVEIHEGGTEIPPFDLN